MEMGYQGGGRVWKCGGRGGGGGGKRFEGAGKKDLLVMGINQKVMGRKKIGAKDGIGNISKYK